MASKNFYHLDFINNVESPALRLCTVWNSDSEVFILIFYEGKTFVATVCGKMFQDWASKTSTTYEEFLECFKYAVTSPFGPKNDTLALNEGELLWQRIFKDFTVTFGSFNMKQLDEDPLVGFIVSSLLDKCHSLSEKVTKLRMKNVFLVSSLNEMQETTEKMIAEKTEMEITLYSKFVHVLNEKNAIIAELNAPD